MKNNTGENIIKGIKLLNQDTRRGSTCLEAFLLNTPFKESNTGLSTANITHIIVSSGSGVSLSSNPVQI